MQLLPVWLQVALALMVPLNGVLLTHLLLERREKRKKKSEDAERASDAKAREHIADLDAQDKFTAQLLVRVRDLETWQVERMKDAEVRTERMAKLEVENVVLSQRLEAMKYELAGKIGAAMGAVEKRVASALIEREEKEIQT